MAISFLRSFFLNIVKSSFMRVHDQTRNISFLFWFATFFWLLKNKYCCVSTCTLLLHDNRYVTQNHSPPPLFFARETTTTKKPLFCFALHLSFWRLWWFFWWRSIVFATVALDELPAVNAQITSTRSDRIFFVPIFNIFFCSGIITAQPSEVDGNGRAMDRGRPPPSTSSCDFRTKLLQRPKNQRSWHVQQCLSFFHVQRGSAIGL